jgi:cytochrome c-type biogenesis protein CcmH
MSWRRYNDAADAFAQAIRLLGESPKRLSSQGQALVLANNGVVTEPARHALERALELDQTLIEPRILLAIAKEQDGRFVDAIADWRALLAAAEANAPWRELVETRIAAAQAQLDGKPEETPGAEPSAGAEGGPSAADIAAAESMAPAERQAMVEQMVQGLAARLDQDGGDLPGWLKLVRAYSVLDRKEDALKALQRAKHQFSGDTQALEQLDRLAAELGLKS